MLTNPATLIRCRLVGLAAVLIPLWLVGSALAQAAPPFYGGPVTAFDVEISIIDSGTLLDAQAVVSSDQRYVTINARADNSSLLALQQFRTQNVSTAGAGFVGGVDPSGQTNAKAAPALPSQIDRAGRDAVSVLNRRGVFLLTSLK